MTGNGGQRPLIYYDLSNSQLEHWADELNRRYRPERLISPSEADVYDIVDLLDARLAIEYITPTRKYLGATIFTADNLWIWPGNPYVQGMRPEKKSFYAGTIIIDKDLNESKKEQDKFIENFTMIHECFHFDNHGPCFKHAVHMSLSYSDRSTGKRSNNYALYRIERQADYGAAAFLMPREAVKNAAREILGYRDIKLPFGQNIKEPIRNVGRLFGVNYSPMVYRLQEIGILEEEFNPYL